LDDCQRKSDDVCRRCGDVKTTWWRCCRRRRRPTPISATTAIAWSRVCVLVSRPQPCRMNEHVAAVCSFPMHSTPPELAIMRKEPVQRRLRRAGDATTRHLLHAAATRAHALSCRCRFRRQLPSSRRYTRWEVGRIFKEPKKENCQTGGKPSATRHTTPPQHQ